MGPGYAFYDTTTNPSSEDYEMDRCEHGVPRKQCGTCHPMTEEERRISLEKLRPPKR
jgi:hypothetical protein